MYEIINMKNTFSLVALRKMKKKKNTEEEKHTREARKHTVIYVVYVTRV